MIERQTANNPNAMRMGLAVAVALIVLDQITKWWILEVVMQPPRVIEATPFFNVVLVWNRGISFGLLNGEWRGNVWILTIIALVIVIGLVVWLRHVEETWMVAAIGMIIGGALGNVIDRVRFGAVADFLDLHVAGYHWPVFNVADSAITVGAAVLVLDSLFARKKEHKNTDRKKTGN